MKKPAIFVDGRVFDTEYQGTRTYIHNLYKIIDQQGDLEIYLASRDPEHAASFFPGAENMHFLRYRSESKIKRAFRELPAMIEHYKIDAAHFQYVTPPVKNCLHVVTIHDLLFKDFPGEFSMNYKLVKGAAFYLSAKRADLVTTVSEYSKKAIVRHFRIPEKDIHVIPNGVSPFFFEPYDTVNARKMVNGKFGIAGYILYVSRIEPRKNQLDLLRSYLDLKLYQQGRHLVFVGKESIPVPELRTTIDALPKDIREKIHFLENIANEDLRLLYQGADLFVYPSKGEGFGIPPLEAAALQVPTICSNTTAMEDFRFFGDNHIVPDRQTLGASISSALGGQPRNLREISEAIRTAYGWEGAAMKMNELLRNKIGHKKDYYTFNTRPSRVIPKF